MESVSQISPSPEEIKWARRAHLSSLLTYILSATPLLTIEQSAILTILIPLIILFSKKKSNYVMEQAGEAAFFQGILSLLFLAIPWLLPGSNETNLSAITTGLRGLAYIGVGGFHLISLLWATISTSYGKSYSHFLSPLKSFFQRKRESEQMDLSSVDDLTKKLYPEVKNNLDEKLKILNKLSKLNFETNIRDRLTAVQNSLIKLMESLNKDPKELINSRHFLTYTLDSLITILQKYDELRKLPSKDTNILSSLEKVEPVLITINDAIQKHHRKILDHTVMQLDAEIEVMQKTMEMGGFS